MTHYVQIIESDSGTIVKEMGPHPVWKCEKIERGAEINLNHDKYHTEIVAEEDR